MDSILFKITIAYGIMQGICFVLLCKLSLIEQHYFIDFIDIDLFYKYFINLFYKFILMCIVRQ